MYERVLSLLPQARRYQHYAVGLCPFHADQHPSLLVTEKRFKCLACGRRGSLRTLLAALNPADRFLSEKLYPARPAFPHILGRDGSGTVEELGAGVEIGRAHV